MLFLSFGLMAQQKQQKQQNTDFVILTSQFEQLEPIMMAAQDETRNGDFQIVLYGNEVKQVTSKEMIEYLELGEKYKARFLVCKMSLDRFKIDPDSIPKEIEVVENAFLYSFLLQKKGYKTLNL